MFADQGFAGRLVDRAAETLKMTVEIVRKPAEQRGFAGHPKRWVVERRLAWLTAHLAILFMFEAFVTVAAGCAVHRRTRSQAARVAAGWRGQSSGGSDDRSFLRRAARRHTSG